MNAPVRIALFPTPLGDCGVAWRGGSVVATRLPDARPEDTLRRIAARTGGCRGKPPLVIRRATDAMAALLGGEATDLSFVACAFEGIEPFAAEVYAATRTVPAGETTTYGALAARLGDGRLARRVGQALGRNPLPIVVPCHRVLGADGRLTGFSAPGGIETKLRILDIEGARVGGEPSLFDDLPLSVRPREER